MLFRLVILATWIFHSSAMVFRLQIDTYNNHPDPMITAAPKMKARQQHDDVLYAAPDNTCGFVDGKRGNARACAPGLTCIFSAASGYMGCCDSGSDCSFQTTCINSRDFSNCPDDECKTNQNTIRCTQSDLPFCASYVFPNMFGTTAFLYDCQSEDPGSSISTLQTTVDGETDLLRMWTTIHQRRGNEIFNQADSLRGEVLPDITMINSAENPSEPPPMATFTVFSPPEVSSGSAAIPTSKQETPILAIVGGLLGGFVILAIVGLGATWLILRERRHRRQEETEKIARANLPRRSNGALKPELGPPITPTRRSRKSKIYAHVVNGGMPPELPSHQRHVQVVSGVYEVAGDRPAVEEKPKPLNVEKGKQGAVEERQISEKENVHDEKEASEKQLVKEGGNEVWYF